MLLRFGYARPSSQEFRQTQWLGPIGPSHAIWRAVGDSGQAVTKSPCTNGCAALHANDQNGLSHDVRPAARMDVALLQGAGMVEGPGWTMGCAQRRESHPVRRIRVKLAGKHTFSRWKVVMTMPATSHLQR